MNVNRTSDGSDGIFTRLAETRLFTDQKFLRFRVGENLDPPPDRPMLKSRCKREEGGKRGGRRKNTKHSLIIQLLELSALSVFCEIQSIRYIHIDRFSQKRHSCRINGYTPCCGQEKRPRLNFVLERHFFLLSFFFVVSNFLVVLDCTETKYMDQLDNFRTDVILDPKKLLYFDFVRIYSYIKYLNK